MVAVTNDPEWKKRGEEYGNRSGIPLSSISLLLPSWRTYGVVKLAGFRRGTEKVQTRESGNSVSVYHWGVTGSYKGTATCTVSMSWVLKERQEETCRGEHAKWRMDGKRCAVF